MKLKNKNKMKYNLNVNNIQKITEKTIKTTICIFYEFNEINVNDVYFKIYYK